MGRTKVYCILSDGTYIYVPVKAGLSPYPDRITGEIKPAYLGLMPNFFGGAVERRDHGDFAAALFREINQESQEKINPEVINISQGNCLYYTNIEGDKYYFWLVDIGADRVSGFGEESNKLLLSDDPDSYEAKFREMQCVLRIPIVNLVAGVRDMGETTDADAFVSLFLKLCGINYGEENFFINRLNQSARAATDTEKKLFNEWNESETKKAFAKLVERLAGLSV